MERVYSTGAASTSVVVEHDGDAFLATIGERSYRVAVRHNAGGVLVIEIDGRQVRAVVAADGARRLVSIDGVAYALEPTSRRGMAAAVAQGDSKATMPGQVVAVYVAAGDTVEKGQPLVLLEAMKMEQQVRAAHAGTVRTVHVAAGEVVARGQVLVEVEAAQ